MGGGGAGGSAVEPPSSVWSLLLPPPVWKADLREDEARGSRTTSPDCKSKSSGEDPGG